MICMHHSFSKLEADIIEPISKMLTIIDTGKFFMRDISLHDICAACAAITFKRLKFGFIW